MAENPYDRNDVLRRDAWDEGFAAGVAAERERCLAACNAPAEEPEQYDGDNHGDSFSSGWENGAWSIAAAIRAGEVRG